MASPWLAALIGEVILVRNGTKLSPSAEMFTKIHAQHERIRNCIYIVQNDASFRHHHSGFHYIVSLPAVTGEPANGIFRESLSPRHHDASAWFLPVLAL